MRSFILIPILTALTSPASADVVIGVAGPMSGIFAPVGSEILAGVTQAVDVLNAAGGVGGQSVVVEVVDDKCEAKTGEAVANQLVGKGAVLVVGHACAAAAIPAGKVYSQAGIVFISPATTNPRFTDERIGPGVFRLAARADEQPKAIAAHLLKAFAGGRVGFASDGSVYGRQITDGAREAFEAGGGTTILNETFTPGEKSQVNLTGKVQDAALDVLVVGAGAADGAVVATEMANRGLSTRLIGGDALGLEEFRDIAGPAATGVIFALPTDYRREPAAADAVAAFRAAGSEAAGFTLPAYAAVEVWAAAAAGGGGFETVAAAIAEGAFPTVIGPVSFDDKGDLEGLNFTLQAWQDGGFEPVP
ncbi:branched-chain amino acid ABC transporter substrate-binding protein [Chthonobacter albigriseus]|uniref:branched-chain amino acid ABC transporter substrate-binding protein n=1 Tax=Chthonobacter albigriseus TaxID=1683161 RepID=UPI0015EF0E7C|nr:branched-chain amino acid ABC transporter substrate-binding protein [Chthonobacter albigriseus]